MSHNQPPNPPSTHLQPPIIRSTTPPPASQEDALTQVRLELDRLPNYFSELLNRFSDEDNEAYASRWANHRKALQESGILPMEEFDAVKREVDERREQARQEGIKEARELVKVYKERVRVREEGGKEMKECVKIIEEVGRKRGMREGQGGGDEE